MLAPTNARSSSADRGDSTCAFDAELTARTDRGAMSVQSDREKGLMATPPIYEHAKEGHSPQLGVADAMSPRWDALQVYLSHSRPWHHLTESGLTEHRLKTSKVKFRMRTRGGGEARENFEAVTTLCSV